MPQSHKYSPESFTASSPPFCLVQLPMEQRILFSYRFLEQYPCADEITYQQ